MYNGYLSSLFVGIIAKKLSVVETTPKISHQHEFNATSAMKTLFGKDRVRINSHYLYLSDNDTIADEGILTWYDARANDPKRSEYRLFYTRNQVMIQAKANDSVFICLCKDGTALVVIAKGDSAAESQLKWLFGVVPGDRFSAGSLNEDDAQLRLITNRVLERLGLQLPVEEDWIDELVHRFGNQFPSPEVFSAYARETAGVSFDDADTVLITWLNQEQMLYRTFAGYLKKQTFAEPVPAFLDAERSEFTAFNDVSLCNHFEALLNSFQLPYSYNLLSADSISRCFVFPGMYHYRNPDYPDEGLLFLRVEDSLRNMEIPVFEDDRVSVIYLLTLEPALSKDQIDGLKEKHVRLVVPAPVQATYEAELRNDLLTVEGFLSVIQHNLVEYGY